MSTYQLGFIGTGNMGGALAQAAVKSGAGMLLSNRTADKAVHLAAELGCAAGTNLEVAEGCKYIFLGVKPQMLQALLAELTAPLSARTDRPCSSPWRQALRSGRSEKRWASPARSCGSCRICRSRLGRAWF